MKLTNKVIKEKKKTILSLQVLLLMSPQVRKQSIKIWINTLIKEIKKNES